MDQTNLTADTTFPYRLFRFAHKRSLDAVSSSYFAVLSKDSHPVGLILMIDIPERWHHAREAATSFWQIYVREFTHSESRSTLIRFEEALKELNKAIVKSQEKIQQPVSVAAVILEDNQIHFSTIGTCRILLARSGTFSDVTAGADKAGGQFAAVTSGDIDSNDIVCITNQNLYEFLASEPAELWQQPSVEQLASEIQSRAQNSQNSLNLVLLQYSTDQSAQATLYWEESEKRYPIRLPKFHLPNLPQFSKPAFPRLTMPKLPKISFGFFRELPALVRRIKRPSRRQLQFGAIAIILAVGLIWVWLRPNQPETSSQNITITSQLSEVAAENTLTFLRENAGTISGLAEDQRTELAQALIGRGIELASLLGVVSELPNSVVDISPAGESLYLVDETGQLWQLLFSGGLKQIDHLFKVGQPTGLVAFSETSLVVTDSLGNIWHYRGEANGPVAVALPAPLSTGVKLIAKYAANLYIYTAESNGIYRASGFAGEITATTPYNNLSAVSGAQLLDFTVNGDFIALTSNGVVSWRRGEQTRSILPYLFTNADSRIDTTEAGLTVIQTDNLITVLTPANELVWQRYFVSDKTISGVAIVGGELWFVANNSVYQVTL